VVGHTHEIRALVTLLVQRWLWLEENGKMV
jgi:hypothetical protein